MKIAIQTVVRILQVAPDHQTDRMVLEVVYRSKAELYWSTGSGPTHEYLSVAVRSNGAVRISWDGYSSHDGEEFDENLDEPPMSDEDLAIILERLNIMFPIEVKP